MSDKDLESETKRFDIYLHLHLNDDVNDTEDVDEEMRSIKDVSVEEYSYDQLILDAHDLALSHFPKCSKESVFVSHELMVRGRRCKTTLKSDDGLKKLFSLNQTTYVFFVKCYDGLPGLQLLGKGNKRSNELPFPENDNSPVLPGLRRLVKAKKKSNKLSLAENVNSPGLPGIRRLGKANTRSNNLFLTENVDSSGSDEHLIKQASLPLVKNVPLPSIAEVDEETMMESANQTNEKGDRTDNASVTHVNALTSMVANGPLASDSEVTGERRITRSMVENAPLASDSEVTGERRITRSMVENGPLASVYGVAEERMNQMGDLTNHVSVPHDYVTDGEPITKVYVRKRRKVSSNELAMHESKSSSL